MKTNLFTNSKNALVFAGCIIVGTVVLVDSNSGDDILTAATRDESGGGDSYRKLMDRKNASHRRSMEERSGSFPAEGDFDEMLESEIEIGDYSPTSEPENANTPLPPKDGPGT